MELNGWTDVWIGGAATTASEGSYEASRTVGEARRAGRRHPRNTPADRTGPTDFVDRADPVGLADPVDRTGPADMVLRAARTARRRSGAPDAGVDLIVHAPAGGPGAMGGTAARVLRGLGCPAATAWEVWRPADGGVLALHLAAQYMSGRPGTPLTALVTATDGVAAYADAGREPPGGERADEAAGLVLTTTAGVARLLATAALGEPPHGALLRSDLPWRVPAHRGAPRGRRWPVVRGAGAWRWGRRVGGPAAAGTPALRVPPGHGITPVHGTPPGRGTPPAPTPQLGEREDEAVRLALAQCGRALEDVAYYVLARADGGERPSGGHVAALARLLEGSRTRRGDTVVLVGGDGRGVGCAVLEVARTS